MNIKDYKNIYMVGIGGISMSGIAEILKSWGYNVSGSDRVSSPLVEKLMENGHHINIGQVSENITSDIDLVIYTAAIHDDNPELVKARELNIPCVERGAFLGEMTKLFKDTIGVSGTHGKTSTTGMLTEIFIEAGKDPYIQIGTTLESLNNTNYRVGKKDLFIIEACEYANSFLNFKERSAIVLNIDNDHLDFFGNIDNIEKSFREYVSHLPSDGFLVTNYNDNRCMNLKNYTKATTISVGDNKNADYSYDNVVYDDNGCPTYDLYAKDKLVGKISLKVKGIHNVFNSACAASMALLYGIDFEHIKNALFNYVGAGRRLEYKCSLNGAKVYDDYGHHPTEILATINGIKNMKFNESWVVFEPHTFSRLSEHLDSFAKALVNYDHIIIIDIYAAREVNTYGISVEDLIEKINKLGKKAIHISNHDEVVNYLKENVKENDIVITQGAGVVTKIGNKIKDLVDNN